MNSLKSLFLASVCVLTFGIPNNGTAQNTPSNVELVTKTIQNYFEGYIERDSTKLYRAFDTENGTMKVPVLSDQKIIKYENKFFRDLLPIWSNREKLSSQELDNCELKILHIDLESDQMGSAKISMKVGEVIYIDILSLQLLKGLWKITNKIYVVK